MDQIQNQVSEIFTMERLLKGNDVAKYLNVSRSFAYLLMQSGNIPTVRLGRSIRVRPSDLEDFITLNTINNTKNSH